MATPDKPTRLIDLARELGVSRPVVAAALFGSGGNTRVSPALAERIRAAAARHGYRPNLAARQLQGAPSRLIGLVIGADNPQANLMRMLHLEQEATRRGYRILISFLHDMADAAALMDDFAARGVDGVLWLHLPFALQQPPPAALFNRIPNVVFNEDRRRPGAGVVRMDYAGGIRQAVRHLATRGHTRIGMILASHGSWPLDPINARRQGFRDELRALGLPGERAHIWYGNSQEPPAPEILDHALAELLDRHRVTAILASNDQWAAEILKRLRHRGRAVPGDVALVGFDNLELARRLDPELTTIDHNHEQFTQAALDLLERQAAQPDLPASDILIPARLVIRQST